MRTEILEAYLRMVGMRYTSLDEFWAGLMNETKGQIVKWLLESDITKMKQLAPYLRPNQIARIELEV